MPKLNVRLASRTEPREGGRYRIEKVEEVTTPVRGYKGLRVTMRNATDKNDTETYTTMLWLRDTAGSNSKIGSFIAAFTKFFGDEEKALDPENWVGHTIYMVSWQDRNREVKVVE